MNINLSSRYNVDYLKWVVFTSVYIIFKWSNDVLGEFPIGLVFVHTVQ